MKQTALKILIISQAGKSPEMIETLNKVVATFPKLVAIAGKDCEKLEDVCDEFCEETQKGLEITTTSHPGESISEVQEFVAAWEDGELGREFLTLTI